MRIAYVGNSRLAVRVLEWLLGPGQAQVVMLGVHSTPMARDREALQALAGLSTDAIVEGQAINTAEGMELLRACGAELLVSVGFGHLLTPNVLRIPARGGVNLHTGLLPYCRGAYPNVWSIVDGVPAGVTLHVLDEGADTGAILAQREVPYTWSDTGASLYGRLQEAAFDLFQAAWPKLQCDSMLMPIEQPVRGGSSHRERDVDRIDRIDLQRSYRAEELLNILRA